MREDTMVWIAELVEEYTREQKEIAKMERRFYRQKHDAMKRMHKANELYLENQRREEARERVLHLARRPWQTWPEETDVVLEFCRGVIKRVVYAKQKDVEKYCEGEAADFTVYLAVWFDETCGEMLLKQGGIRGESVWQAIVR